VIVAAAASSAWAVQRTALPTAIAAFRTGPDPRFPAVPLGD
jgi:hypothetical protein